MRCLLLFDYILREAGLYAVEIATRRGECSDNRIFTGTSSGKHRANET